MINYSGLTLKKGTNILRPNLTNPYHLLAFGFGSGLSPVAPGTVGTLAAIPLYLLIALLPTWTQVLLIIVGFVIGIYVCARTSEDLGVHDHSGIVWDEFVGFWLTMLIATLFKLDVNITLLLAGFVCFRFYDIIKPWPIAWVDSKVTGGLGIMLDDVLAAVYAGLTLPLGLAAFASLKSIL